MSDSGYWTSLWGLGILIFLGFFCLFAGSAVIVFFSDRISAQGLWNSPVWLKMKIPFIILGVIGFVVGAFALSRHQGQKEMQAAQEYAQSQGWGFSRYATQELTALAEETLWDFRSIYLYYIRTVETGQRSLYLFDCSYNRKADVAGSRSAYGVACLIQSERFSPATVPADIVGRDWTEVMISDKVDMGESPFSKKFLVLSKNPAAAQQTVSPAIQAIMLEHLQEPLYNPVCVSLGPGGAVVLTGRTNEPERLQDIIDLARRIESAQ